MLDDFYTMQYHTYPYLVSMSFLFVIVVKKENGIPRTLKNWENHQEEEDTDTHTGPDQRHTKPDLVKTLLQCTG